MPAKRGLMERLNAGEYVLAAEGYLYEVERRGYLKAGSFVPECVVEHPEVVEALSREFVHAGSDVVLCFTYYGHREKLKLINRELELEDLNRKALRIARKVADETGALMAGNICNSTQYDPDDKSTHEFAAKMFKEQVEWAVQEDADFILGETYSDLGEAKLALEAIQKYGQGRPSVIAFAPNTSHKTRDGYEYADACKQIEDLGADVVGLNCSFGPVQMLAEIKKVRAACKGHIACLPVTYRTTDELPQMQSLVVPDSGKRAFFENQDWFYCTSDHMHDFGTAIKDLNVKYVGLCCGCSSRHFRRLAESLGRRPPASKYSTDMSLHYVYGDQKHFQNVNTKVLHKLNSPLDKV